MDVSKSEFATALGISAARVSQYIKEGKIDGDALVGEGRSARIRPDVARAQLNSRLDISQRTGNGLKTRIAPAAAAEDLVPMADAQGGFEDEMRAEKLEQARIQTRKMRADEQARSGRYVLTADASAAMGKLAARIVGVFEGGTPDLAAAIAEKFEVPVRDVTHLLQRELKALREKAAAAERDLLGSVPELVADETDEGQSG